MQCLVLAFLFRDNPRGFFIHILVGFICQCSNFTDGTTKLTCFKQLSNTIGCASKFSVQLRLRKVCRQLAIKTFSDETCIT
ncbi:Uncharacterised protein [Vibrio cholerae]|nr:Uncharacterised protein [Vibrio cholerae]CSC34683.1 Uncharacterised protein [Vibrio cholerae]CSI32795.1 Uncharacterised protein [Vibrio cholerae]